MLEKKRDFLQNNLHVFPFLQNYLEYLILIIVESFFHTTSGSGELCICTVIYFTPHKHEDTLYFQ